MLGVGMAAMRDVVSFFRYAAADSTGTANPIAGAVPHVVAMGNSQSGRFAKAFLNLGFNQDERGRIVWDGLNARIAGMLGSFNARFAQPGDIAELYDLGAEGPLWWGDYVDSRARPARVGLAPPLHRDEDLSEDHRDLWRAGALVQPRQRRHRRDRPARRTWRFPTTSVVTTIPARRTAADRAASAWARRQRQPG